MEWKKEMSALLKEITGKEPLQHGYLDHGQELQPDTICVIMDIPTEENPSVKDPFDSLIELRERLPNGFVAFVGHTSWEGAGRKHRGGAELAIGQGESQEDIVRLAGTADPNGDVENETMISNIRLIREHCEIDIVHAQYDSMTFVLVEQPKDILKFFELLMDICGDLSQSDYDLDAPEEWLNKDQIVHLWWD